MNAQKVGNYTGARAGLQTVPAGGAVRTPATAEAVKLQKVVDFNHKSSIFNPDYDEANSFVNDFFAGGLP